MDDDRAGPCDRRSCGAATSRRRFALQEAFAAEVRRRQYLPSMEDPEPAPDPGPDVSWDLGRRQNSAASKCRSLRDFFLRFAGRKAPNKLWRRLEWQQPESTIESQSCQCTAA